MYMPIYEVAEYDARRNCKSNSSQSKPIKMEVAINLLGIKEDWLV